MIGHIFTDVSGALRIAITRADLHWHPAFQKLDYDSLLLPCVWGNDYECNVCTSETVSWADQWSSQCNDHCPKCGRETEPTDSTWLPNCAEEDTDPAYVLWRDLPETAPTNPNTNRDCPDQPDTAAALKVKGMGFRITTETFGLELVETSEPDHKRFNCLAHGETLPEICRYECIVGFDMRFNRSRGEPDDDRDTEECPPSVAEFVTIYAVSDLGAQIAIHDAKLTDAGADEVAATCRALFAAIIQTIVKPE